MGQRVRDFSNALRFAGGNCRTVTNGFETAAAIESIVAAQGDQRSLLYEPCELADQLGLPLALSARGIRLEPVHGVGASAAEFRVGLTAAPLAIAESGTLLIGGHNGGWGLATILPWVHVALLRSSDLAPDLVTAFDSFHQRFEHGERNWVWITGPSKTADIAKTLVMGIHGPNALEVLVVDDGGVDP